MRTKVRKWGNSLAVRIPKSVGEELQLSDGKSVELTVENQTIVVRPVQKKRAYRLNDLLAGITDENLHSAVDFGKSVGKEWL